jgi:hypothetical protein
MTKGQRIIIHATGGVMELATVLEVATPDQLPDIPEAPPAAMVEPILREMGITRMMFISIQRTEPEHNEVVLWVLEKSDGSWRDLHGQMLWIFPQ